VIGIRIRRTVGRIGSGVGIAIPVISIIVKSRIAPEPGPEAKREGGAGASEEGARKADRAAESESAAMAERSAAHESAVEAADPADRPCAKSAAAAEASTADAKSTATTAHSAAAPRERGDGQEKQTTDPMES